VDTEFRWPVRVYYEDTDNGGVVYYANYLKFMERARTEWLRTRGVEQDRAAQRDGVIFAVRSAQVDYLKPGRFNQLLAVSVKVVEAGRASLTFEQTVSVTDAGHHDDTDDSSTEGEQCGSVLCQGRIKIACLDVGTLRPRAIPASMRQEIFGDG